MAESKNSPEFERFKEAMKKIVRTPKSEIKEALKRERKTGASLTKRRANGYSAENHND